MDHDLIIIGGGAGGLGALRAALWAKADVLMINDGPPGGDCTFTGCVPSKTLLSAARGGASFDEAMARVHATVDRIAATETADVLVEHGASFIEDRARLVTHDSVAVGERRISAPRIIVATGGRASAPPIPGLADTPHHTNETIFSLASQPTRLGIIGGGAIGCEMAEAFAVLGTEVTLVEGADRLLPREEPAASAIVEAALRRRGVEILTGTTIGAVAPSGAEVHLTARERTIAVDQLLVAVGRTPNTEGLGLEDLGATLDERGHVETDDRLQTGISGVYAVGDVTGKLPFTHAADEMGRLAAGNALKKGIRGRYRTHHTPWVTFTSPEVARVGMTEAEAAATGSARVVELPMSEMDRAITDGREDGFIMLITGPKLVTRHAGGGNVIGATIVADRAGEMINEVAFAMRTRAFAGRLAQTVHAYPTWSYGLQKVAAQLFGEVEGRTWRPARA
ncbi:MAG: FAD-dependent oxidoreductase [Actinomycetota bacterium]